MLAGRAMFSAVTSAFAVEFASKENPAAPIALVFKKFRRFNLESFIKIYLEMCLNCH